MASQPLSSTTICKYTFDSYIRGYDAYEDGWNQPWIGEVYIRGYDAYEDSWNQPWIGEVLPLERDPTNPQDKFAVAVKKCRETVGHLPS